MRLNMKIVGRGIDTLVIAADGDLRPSVLADLEALAGGAPGTVRFGDVPGWRVEKRIGQGYLVRAPEDTWLAWIGQAAPRPIVQVRPLARTCWALSPHDLIRTTWGILEAILRTPENVRFTRVDIAVDVAGWVPSQDERAWVGRFRGSRIHYDAHMKSRRFTGWSFGDHRNLQVAVYNKSVEIVSASQKTWFGPLWQKSGYDPEADGDVWRVEVRMGSDRLRRAELIRELPANDGEVDVWIMALRSAWRAVVGPDAPWIREVVVGRTRSRRAKTTDAWRTIQGAWGVGPRIDWVEIRHAGARHAARLLRQAAGVLLAAGRAVGAHDADETWDQDTRDRFVRTLAEALMGPGRIVDIPTETVEDVLRWLPTTMEDNNEEHQEHDEEMGRGGVG